MNKNHLRLHFACWIVAVLCGATAWATPAKRVATTGAASTTNAAPANGAFEQLVDDFVLGTLALSPTNATSFGYHVHKGGSLDDLLDDFSPAGIAASRSMLQDFEARIAASNVAALENEQK